MRKGRKPLFQANQLWRRYLRKDSPDSTRPRRNYKAKGFVILLHDLVIHMLILHSVKWQLLDIQYLCGILSLGEQLIFMSWTPQIPFQLGLSKTDLRRVLKSSLSGVSRHRSCFTTAMYLFGFCQTNYTQWKLSSFSFKKLLSFLCPSGR
jgi:hypothetical protein